MCQIFISHSSGNAEVAEKLVQALERNEISAWYYPAENRGGQDYIEDIVTALSESDIVAVLISPQALASKEVDREVKSAFKNDKPLLPILVDITHEDFQQSKRGKSWAHMLGTSITIAVETSSFDASLPYVVRDISNLLERSSDIEQESHSTASGSVQPTQNNPDAHETWPTPAPKSTRIKHCVLVVTALVFLALAYLLVSAVLNTGHDKKDSLVEWIQNNNGEFFVSNGSAAFTLGDEGGNIEWTRSPPASLEEVVAIRFHWDRTHKGVDDDSLAKLEVFPNLRGLLLRNCDLSTECADHISRLTSLQTLHLDSARIEESIMKELASLTDIRELHLPADWDLDQVPPLHALFPKLEYLNTYRSKLGVNSAASLAKLQSLRDLELDDAEMDEEAALELLKSTAIEELIVGGKSITATRLEVLMSSLPPQLNEFGLKGSNTLKPQELVDVLARVKSSLDMFVLDADYLSTLSVEQIAAVDLKLNGR